MAIDSHDAVTVAGRFGSAYAAWDAGERAPRVRRQLRRTATAELVSLLLRDGARPVAHRPTALRLRPGAAYRLAGGSYAVPLLLAGRRSFHVLTVLVAATPGGARVTRLER